jgi:hypothetical protein
VFWTELASTHHSCVSSKYGTQRETWVVVASWCVVEIEFHCITNLINTVKWWIWKLFLLLLFRFNLAGMEPIEIDDTKSFLHARKQSVFNYRVWFGSITVSLGVQKEQYVWVRRLCVCLWCVSAVVCLGLIVVVISGISTIHDFKRAIGAQTNNTDTDTTSTCPISGNEENNVLHTVFSSYGINQILSYNILRSTRILLLWNQHDPYVLCIKKPSHATTLSYVSAYQLTSGTEWPSSGNCKCYSVAPSWYEHLC